MPVQDAVAYRELIHQQQIALEELVVHVSEFAGMALQKGITEITTPAYDKAHPEHASPNLAKSKASTNGKHEPVEA